MQNNIIIIIFCIYLINPLEIMLVVMSSDGQTAGSKAQSRTTEAASHVQYYQWSIISITIKPGPVCVHVKDLGVPFF